MMNPVNQEVQRVVIAVINEATELASEAAKFLKYGEDFKRDNTHTSLERISNEYEDLVAAIDNLNGLVGNNFNTLAHRYVRKSAILRMEQLMLVKGLLPIPKACYDDVTMYFIRYEKWYSDFPISDDTGNLPTDKNWTINYNYLKYFDAIAEYFNSCVETGYRPKGYKPTQNISYADYMDMNCEAYIEDKIAFYGRCREKLEGRMEFIQEMEKEEYRNKADTTREYVFLQHQIKYVNDIIDDLTKQRLG